MKGCSPERVMGEIQVSIPEKKPLNLPSKTTELTVKPAGVIPLRRQRRDKNRYTLE